MICKTKGFSSKFFFQIFLFLFSLLVACISFKSEKYGFKGRYIYPFQDGSRYIELIGDAESISFILKEVENEPPKILVRLVKGSLGNWFNLANVRLTLPGSKSYILSGPIRRWGEPSFKRSWTETLNSIDIVQRRPLDTIINEVPSKDGQIYTWTDEFGYDEDEGYYGYRVNTGRFNVINEPSMTYEAIFAENLSDEDLKIIFQAETVSLLFTSHILAYPPQYIKGIDNRSDVKEALMKHYFATKEMMRTKLEFQE